MRYLLIIVMHWKIWPCIQVSFGSFPCMFPNRASQDNTLSGRTTHPRQLGSGPYDLKSVEISVSIKLRVRFRLFFSARILYSC
jgi:hypothetical protein